MQQQFYKYMVLKVSEKVRENLKQPEDEVQYSITDIKKMPSF